MKGYMRVLALGGTAGVVLALLVLASIVVALHVRGQPGSPSNSSLSDGLTSTPPPSDSFPSWNPDMAAPWTPPEFEPYPWIDPPGTPSWFNNLVEEILNDPWPSYPARSIYRYMYHGQVVYYDPGPAYPDEWSTLYDVNGNVLAHPSGGFTGLGDGRVRDFWQEKTGQEIVWHNPRGPVPAAGSFISPPPNPSWLNDLIAEFESKPAVNPPRSIHYYFYEGEVVYYVPSEQADTWSTLYDVDGNILGHPDGGPAGEGDGSYRDFLDKRVAGTLIWRDSRTYSP